MRSSHWYFLSFHGFLDLATPSDWSTSVHSHSFCAAENAGVAPCFVLYIPVCQSILSMPPPKHVQNAIPFLPTSCQSTAAGWGLKDRLGGLACSFPTSPRIKVGLLPKELYILCHQLLVPSPDMSSGCVVPCIVSAMSEPSPRVPANLGLGADNLNTK